MEKTRTTITSVAPGIPSELTANLRGMPQISFRFVTNGRPIHVDVANTSQETAATMVARMQRWLAIALPCAAKGCCKTLHVVVYAVPHRKQLPKQLGAPIGRLHVNSAFTTSCPTHGKIVLFREEEWFKVFVHETFHCFGFDFSQRQARSTTAMMHRTFAIQSEMLLFESYAETWARLLNAAFFLLGQPGVTEATFGSTFSVLVQLEGAFACEQACRILNHFSMDYADCLTSNRGRSARFREKSNVLCYYVVTALLLSQFDQLVALLGSGGRCPFGIQSEAQFASLVERLAKQGLKEKGEKDGASLRMALIEFA
jgi:hypothetical protein